MVSWGVVPPHRPRGFSLSVAFAHLSLNPNPLGLALSWQGLLQQWVMSRDSLCWRG